jgi:hypothetical protein
VRLLVAVAVRGLGPSPPSPANATVTLEYSAPAECPDAAAVEQMVRESLDAVPSDGRRHQVHAIATIDNDDPSLFRLDLTIHAEDDRLHRTLTDASCEQLTRAGATLIAIAVDPRLGTLAPTPSSDTEATVPDVPAQVAQPPPSTAASEPVSEPARPGPDRHLAQPPDVPTRTSTGTLHDGSLAVVAARPALPRPHWGLAIGGGASVNLLPGFAGLATAAIDLSWPSWRLSGGVRTEPAKRGGTSEATGQFSIVAAAVEGCAVPLAGALEFPLCLGIAVGGMRGRAVDTPERNVGWFPWLSAHAGPALRWRVHPRVHPWIAAEVVLPVLRGVFVVDMAREPIDEPGRIGAAARIGLAFPLGRQESHGQ